MQALFARLLPFFIMGMMIVIFVVGIIFLSYLLIFGALIGLVLFIITWVRQTFFPPKDVLPKKQGRIIEHDDDRRHS